MAVLDISGALIHADQEDYTLILLQGTLAELSVKIALEIHSKHIEISHDSRKILHVRLKKTAYGCLKSTLLFFNKLVGDRIRLGFKLNLCDLCIANKVVYRTQMKTC